LTEAPVVPPDQQTDRLNWRASAPFFAFHLALALVFVTGVQWQWVLLAFGSYAVRMMAMSAGFHRYFSHRAFRTNRLVQFGLAFVAQASWQRGVLWWATHHRQHHKHADTEIDVHSPVRRSFWWSHAGWLLSKRHDKTDYDAIKDFSRFPELVWLNEHPLVPLLTGLVIAGFAGGLPAIVWACVVPTVLVWHASLSVNSVSHLFGSRRYLTPDTSRNSLLIALLTFGEGWHNNHHSAQATARLGWFWWELDFTWYALELASWVGVVRDLRLPRVEQRDAYLGYSADEQALLKAQSRSGKFDPGEHLPTPQERPAVEFERSRAS
jgi:stearoyl-CoA desaturase (Delta-9 desaturase)